MKHREQEHMWLRHNTGGTRTRTPTRASAHSLPQRTFLSFQRQPQSERRRTIQTFLTLTGTRRRVVDWKLHLMEIQRNSNLFFISLHSEKNRRVSESLRKLLLWQFCNSSNEKQKKAKKTPQKAKKLKASGKKEKKTKSHYKVYFPLLCGSLKKQIAFQYFINKWVCEQWPSDGSIVSEPNCRMPQAGQPPGWLHSSSRESAKKKFVREKEREEEPLWRVSVSVFDCTRCFVRRPYLW